MIFNKFHNYKWSKKQLFNLYKKDNPDWDDDKCIEMASLVYKELNRLNYNMYSNDVKFFNHTTPFSFNSYLEDGNFDEFKKDRYYIENYKKDINHKIIKYIIKDLNKEDDYI